jgi:hypothetical protein
MGSSRLPDRLTSLQRDLLAAFFEREKRFFLTGGAALAGFYFGHRDTASSATGLCQGCARWPLFV